MTKIKNEEKIEVWGDCNKDGNDDVRVMNFKKRSKDRRRTKEKIKEKQ